MTARDPVLGPLGRRLLAAFVLVALSSVGLVTAAALVGSSLGVARSESATRDQVAVRVAALAADAFRPAGNWRGADLSAARTAAASAGAVLSVLDAQGQLVAVDGRMRPGMGMGGPGAGVQQVRSTAPVLVDGDRVGAVVLGFGRTAAAAGGRRLAWAWILPAAVAASLVAGLAGWLVVRWLVRPLAALTRATRRYGAGDATARPEVRGVGELAELATAFDRAAESVQRADRARRQMTADVAHELRTPLSALQAGLEELRDGLVEPDRMTLTRLHDQTLRLTRTVQELSDLSSADAAATELHPVPVDLAAQVRLALEVRGPQLRTAGLVIHEELAEGVRVAVDPDRFQTVVGNLLDNCARHCRPGDDVTVRVCLGPAGPPPTARMVVRDSGPGIPPEDLPRVLERFWRGRDRQSVAGTGIGLAVVATLVKAHGGQLDVASDGDTGTTVTVDLPPA